MKKLVCFFICLNLIFCIGVTGAHAENGIKLTTLMYHHMTMRRELINKHTVSVSMFENDLAYLKKNGYTFVGSNDLFDYVEGKIDLPKKVVMITFDDGFYSFYRYAMPLIKKYRAKVVMSVVGKWTDKFSGEEEDVSEFAYMSWKHLENISKSGLVEIHNHTYDMHKTNKGDRMGILRKSGESEAQYISAVRSDLTSMQKKLKQNLGVSSKVFAYPYGYNNELTHNIVAEVGFKMELLCSFGHNIVTKNFDSVSRINRINRSPQLKLSNIL